MFPAAWQRLRQSRVRVRWREFVRSHHVVRKLRSPRARQRSGQDRAAQPCNPVHHASFARRLQERELLIIQLREGDAFRVAIELFVLLFVGRHFRTLCSGTENENRGKGEKGPKVWLFFPSRCFGQLLSSPMRCYYRWLPDLGSEVFLGIEERLYLTQRTASGRRPFFSSQN